MSGRRAYKRVSGGATWSEWWDGHVRMDSCISVKASCWMCPGQTLREIPGCHVDPGPGFASVASMMSVMVMSGFESQ